MAKFFGGGFMVLAALLIVGLTFGPSGDGGAAAGPPAAVAQAGEVSFRTEGEGTGNIVEVRLDAVETVQEIAEGVEYNVWTFNGTAPGPVIRVKQGDTVRFTLTNKSELGLSHSIDFHAAQTPWNVNYQPVPPGETLTFDWVARFPGVFMYHCGVPPVLHHIANGMYGAIIVEPEEALEPAREYVLVSSELYPGEKPVDGLLGGDPARMEEVDPEYVVFDGYANRYLDEPLQARPDELVRIWVMNAGPTLTNAFHVIGALFDHVYPSGNPTSQLNGLQTWNVPPGDGAMFELRIPDEGVYPFVTHAFAYTGLGSVGAIEVTPDAPEPPASYPLMGDPFTGGVAPSAYEPEGGPPAADGEEKEEPAEEPAEGEITLTSVNVAFEPTDLMGPAGASVAFVNEDALPHDFTIDELHVHVPVGANETETFTLPDEPGTYTFYCSIPGHREAGMEGTLTVQ